jgi:general secretion pathway protein B
VSLILEALNRSARDRQDDIGAVHDPATYFERSDSPQSRLMWLPWLALLFALLVIVWLLTDRSSAGLAQVSSTQKKASSAVQNLPASVPEPVNVVPSVIQEQIPELTAEEKEVEPNLPDSAVAALYAPAEEKAADLQPSLAVKKTAVSVTESPIDLEEILARTKEAMKTARLSKHPAPFLSTLSQQAKNDIPTMLYSAHDYFSKSGRSTVVINGKSLSVGGSIAGGVKIDEILSDSIVLSHRGTQFRLRALNSWVNL